MTERLQIRFEFNTIEDRLLLRISDKEEGACVEYRLSFTRRFTGIFIGAIDKIIEDELAADINVSPDAIDAMKRFQKESALSKADFSTSYGADSQNCKIFSDNPLLVTTLKIKRKSKGIYMLSLLNNENLGVHLTASMEILHTLHKMMVDAGTKAGWNAPLFKAIDDMPPKDKTAGYDS